MPLIHRRWLAGRTIISVLILTGLCGLYLVTSTTSARVSKPAPEPVVHQPKPLATNKPAPPAAHSDEDEWNPSHYVTGNMTSSFRSARLGLCDNKAHSPPTLRNAGSLKPDLKYLTGFLGGGFTNDFMALVRA